jgi:hypothetical protein
MDNTSLTSEELRKQFLDNFGMTNFAISVARLYVDTHQSGSLNEILAEVKKLAKERKA